MTVLCDSEVNVIIEACQSMGKCEDHGGDVTVVRVSDSLQGCVSYFITRCVT